MRLRRRDKRKTIAVARLLAGLESEARRESLYRPRKAHRLSVGRA
jgi:hypothetical protein